MSHNAAVPEFHIDPHTGDKSITGSLRDVVGELVTIKDNDVDYYTLYDYQHRPGDYGNPEAVPYSVFNFVFDQYHNASIVVAREYKAQIIAFMKGKAVQVDSEGNIVNHPATDQEGPTMSEDLAQVKRDVNTLGLSIAALIRAREEEVSRIYGGFRLEVVAKTDTTPMYADLFGLNVIDPDPADEATDTIVCAINMIGANMCQHKQFPDNPEDNQWVIEILTADGKSHRFHTHSAGDFGLIFDAVRAGVTTKVYSTRPSAPLQPSPDSGSET
ncbi:MAG: hypothetical protein K0U41_00705 [Gammaproteobacteria bacterium]|nr:hypothetical protein [Gammaproteobacteria bacterium]